VAARLEERTRGRVRPDRLRTDFAKLDAEEVSEHLGDLFEDLVPNFGYRLLAGLARRRRIYVINLCWDALLDEACRRQKVVRVSYDPADGRSWESVCSELPDGRGLVNCHVHGQLGGHVRFGTFETSAFRGQAREHVAQMLSHETLVIGASLADFDVVDALDEIAAAPKRWVFGRSELLGPEQTVHQAYRIISPGVDFDDVMQVVAERDAAAEGIEEASWDELREARPELGLPPSHELVRIDAEVLCGLLDAPVVGLLGSGFSAKTTTAWRVAHLRRLLAAGGPRLAGLRDLEAIVSEVAVSEIDPEPKILLLDDPYGGITFEENPRIEDLIRRAADGGWNLTVVVSSRLSLWRRGAGSMLEETEGAAVPPSEPMEWFATDALMRLAKRLGADEKVLQMVRDRDIKTPAMLVAVVEGQVDRDSPHRHRDLLDLLRSNPDLATACGLVALQDFRTQRVRLAEATALIGRDPHEVQDIGVFLHFYKLDGTCYAVFRHDDTAEATRAWLAEGGLERIESLPAPWIETAVAGWRQRNAANARPEPEWAAVWMRRNNEPQHLEQLINVEYDQWTIADLASETVRLWPKLRREEAGQQLLERILGDRPAMGVYAVLEACLYMGVKAEDGLWHRVGTALEELSRQQKYRFETDLAVDALCWRRPPGTAALSSWARDYLANLSRAEPSWALIRFLAGYHPAGFREFGPETVIHQDLQHEWRLHQARYAARLAAWHFAHQARARVQLSGNPHIDKSWLCRDINPDAPADHFLGQRVRLISSLAAKRATAGWAFQVGCAQRSMGSLPTDAATDNLLREALGLAPSGDAGVMSAVLTYESAAHFTGEIRARAQDPNEREALLRGMRDGLRYFKLRVCPPRFLFARDPARLHELAGIGWGSLNRLRVPTDPSALADRMRESFHALEPQLTVRQQRVAMKVMVHTESGDLTALANAAARSGKEEVDVTELFRRAIEAVEPSQQQEKLL
jgi:hypothetical protein